MSSDTPRTDEVTLGEWEYGRDEDGNKQVAALDYEVLRDRSKLIERELAASNELVRLYTEVGSIEQVRSEKKAREEAERYSAEQGKVIESRNAELDAEKKAREEAEQISDSMEALYEMQIKRAEAAEARVRKLQNENNALRAQLHLKQFYGEA